MNVEKHVITYPGFAEGKDAKELYPDLEKVYGKPIGPHRFHILPFYEQADEEADVGDRVVHTFEEHAAILQRYMDSLRGEITIIGKCGGTRVVGSMDDEHIARAKKIALINMPWGTGKRDGLERLFRSWGGGPISEDAYPEGSWQIPRGLESKKRYVIENDYMDGIGGVSMVERCKKIGSLTRLFIVRGLEDEMVPPVHKEKIPNAEFIDIEGGNHHLTKGFRPIVIRELGAHGVLQKR